MSAIATDTLYQAFGTTISSEIPLPLPLASDTALTPAWSIVRGHREAAYVQGDMIAEDCCRAVCHNGQVINRTYRGEDDTWIWFRDIGLCHISIADRQITVYADPGADDRHIGLVLIGQVSIYMLQRLGFPILHASAVLVDGEAIAFVAPAGSGKSTMAASFLRRGATLLSDDVLPLVEHGDHIYAMPGAPMMKVWSQTATETLGIHEPLPDLTATVAKKLLSIEGRFSFATSPVPLRAIYLLRRFDPSLNGESEALIVPLRQSEALPLLLVQAPRRDMLFPSESAQLLPLYAKLVRQVPVRGLGVPDGFEYQDAVRDRILADVGVQS